MSLILFVGPMKSGKSSRLVSHFDPYKHTDTPFILVQPRKNIRDKNIFSRMGIEREAIKVASLSEILDTDAEIIGIDEWHMFDPKEVKYVQSLLEAGKEIFISGLDMDYRGELFSVYLELLALGPKEVHYHRAACVGCKKLNATHTQIFHHGIAVTGGLPSVIPEDGTYQYDPVCRYCFVCPSAHTILDAEAAPSL